MRLLVTCLTFLFGEILAYAQPVEYKTLIQKAEEQLAAKDYSAAGRSYSAAFQSFGWKGYQDDRYNAARAWAMANEPDSAFFNLYRIVEKMEKAPFEPGKK